MKKNAYLEYEINNSPNHIVVNVVDTNTGEIIRRIPHLESSPSENNLGNLVDEKV
ncbi:flagellar protein FlaG [candidate division KSB1 bacterium]|nr:flagellar protein FlaG [candidate division KSB1 bacterium]